MFRHECYKIYAKPAVILFMIAAFIFNGVQLVYLENFDRNGYSNYTVEAYHKIWQDLSLYTEQNGGSWGCALDKLSDMLLMLETERHILYTESYYAEQDLYETVRTEIEFTVNYKEYIDSMYSSAEKLSLLPMYSDKNSFAYKKLMITPKLYERMKSVEPKCEPSLGISMAVNDEVTDVIAIAIILYICISLWQKEREQGLITLLRTSYRGRGRLAGCKVLVLTVSIFFISLILYGTNMFLAVQTYGFGDLSRPLASVYEFGTTHWNISVISFLVCFVLIKAFALIFLALIVSLVFLLLSNALLAQLIVCVLMAVSYILYFKTDALSLFSPVKYLSPIGILKIKNIFLG
ncbi:MAG: hypothetical protein J6B39_02720, partial [Lachnospiraceae bacterium]|nr:hypothetical protein [Lachnospiraceae bacterium]